MDVVKTGALIAQARKEKELTQKALAEQLHVSVQAVSKWERGLSCPDIGLLEPLAEALNLTVTELLSGRRGEEPKMVLNLTPHSEAWSEEEQRWTQMRFDCGISFLGLRPLKGGHAVQLLEKYPHRQGQAAVGAGRRPLWRRRSRPAFPASPLRQVSISPGLHIADYIHEAPAQIGQGIFHPRRDLLEVVPNQEAVGLQFPELLRQGRLCYLLQLAAQGPESANIAKGYIVENFQLPFAAQNLLKGRHGLAALNCRFRFSHGFQPPGGHYIAHAVKKQGTAKKYRTFIFSAP